MSNPLRTLPVDPPSMRNVLANFPTGVVVVTANTSNGPVGLTLQSFLSLSLDPPLVQLAVAKSSRSWPAIGDTGGFVVSILAASQGATARQFARSGGDKFAGVAMTQSRALGHPQIEGAVAWVECETHSIHPGGDHDIIVARVVGLDVSDPAREPLVFFRSAFSTVPATAPA